MEKFGRFLLLVFISSQCNIVVTFAGNFPARTNILFVLDVNLADESILDSITTLLDGISLMKYRISLASTNGLTQDSFHYQSRQCLLQKLKRQTSKHHQLLKILVKAASNFFRNFKTDDKIVVIVTSKALSRNVENVLSRFFRRRRSHSMYSIVLPDKNRFAMLREIVVEINKGLGYTVKKLVRGDIKARVLQDLDTFDDVLEQLDFYQDNLKSCPSDKPVYDECRRECRCVDGKLTDCTRIRRQFSSLPLEERQYYINAYKEVASGKTFARRYYELMMIHVNNFKKLHAAPMLLTWHRRFIYEFENLLRLLDCRLTIPYWNFPLFENTTYKSTPSSHHFWDNVGGLGSTKTDINNGYCVESGEFSWEKWKTMKIPDWYLIEFVYSVCYDHFYSTEDNNTTIADECAMKLRKTRKKKCVMRNPGCFETLPSYKRIYDVLDTFPANAFEEFEKIFRKEWHIVMHDCMGGNMGSGVSNYSPEFWPFHSMIDAIWTFWQNKGPEYKKVLMNDTETMLIGFNEPRALFQDNDNVGGCDVKIKYTNIFPFVP